MHGNKASHHTRSIHHEHGRPTASLFSIFRGVELSAVCETRAVIHRLVERLLVHVSNTVSFLIDMPISIEHFSLHA